MSQYTFSFQGELIVEAETEEDARELADELLATTAWVGDHCVDHSIHEIELVNVDEDTVEEDAE